jgi:hypothetical protein
MGGHGSIILLVWPTSTRSAGGHTARLYRFLAIL